MIHLIGFEFQVDLQITACALEGIDKRFQVSASHSYDPTDDLVLTAEDRLAEQVEEGLFTLLYWIFLAQGESRYWNRFGADLSQLMADVNTQLTQLIDVVIILQLSHQSLYFPELVDWILDGGFWYFFPSKLIEIIRNASHQAEFWHK